MAKKTPFAAVSGGITLDVRLTPKATHNRIGPLAADTDENLVLKVAVTAPPEDGKANAALIKLLAKSLGLPKSAISLKRGSKDRRKTLFIDIDTSDIGPEELLKRLSGEL